MKVSHKLLLLIIANESHVNVINIKDSSSPSWPIMSRLAITFRTNCQYILTISRLDFHFHPRRCLR